MFGLNGDYQCGSKYYNVCHKPNIIRINGEYIKHIKCASYHNIIKTHNNTYYSFGKNDEQQLLIKNSIVFSKKSMYKPKLISTKYLYSLTKSKKCIIDLIPINNQTYIIQDS